jgi:hypothetical protein
LHHLVVGRHGRAQLLDQELAQVQRTPEIAAVGGRARMVLYRDTLQLANLDANEVEGTIEALSLALAEFAGELIEFSHR